LAAGSPALPDGLIFESVGNAVGRLHGTPVSGESGYSETVIFKVVDNLLVPATLSLMLTFNNSGLNLLDIDSSGVTPVKRGAPYRAILSAGGGQAPYYWYVDETSTHQLPDGLKLSVTGEIVGRTTQVYSNSILVRVVDSQGAFGTAQVKVETVPSLTGYFTLPPIAHLGETYNESLGNFSSANLPLVWSFEVLSNIGIGNDHEIYFPYGLALDPLQGKISGVPTSLYMKDYNIHVTDSIGDTQMIYGIFTVTNMGLRIYTTSLPPAVVGKPYSFQMTGGDPNDNTIHNYWRSGELPPSFSFSSGGILSSPKVPDSLTGKSPDLRIETYVDSQMGPAESVSGIFTLLVSQSADILSGPDYVNGTSENTLGVIEVATNLGYAQLSGNVNDMTSRPNKSFMVGVVGLPQTGVTSQMYYLSTDNPSLPMAVLASSTPTLDPTLGPIYWWYLMTGVAPLTPGLQTVKLTLSGPGISPSLTKDFKILVKNRKTFSIVDSSNFVVSDQGNNY
jgi:hypothetical protein